MKPKPGFGCGVPCATCATKDEAACRWAILALTTLLPFLAATAKAEQMQRFGAVEAHYAVIPSLFLQPEVAQRHGLRRRQGLSLVNISVLDSAGKGRRCTIQGTARNLLEQTTALEFQEVREGDAVYYLAQVHHADQEVLRFSLDIQPDQGKPFTLNFQQRLHEN